MPSSRVCRAHRPRRLRRALVGVAAFVASVPALAAAPVAPRPPMGWNSWDAFGFTITEAQFKANVEQLSRWKRLGWRYAVIDEGWYMADPLGGDVAHEGYQYDRNGRLIPAVARFPESANGRGLKALSDWTHARGLKFGIHIVRGIPKAAVAADLPIAGSPFHAADAVDRDATCPWDQANFGVADNAAGQAWYDSLLRQYAGWGVDFLKVDCIASHPYRPSEIRQIGLAIKKTGRPMVLSLSPGPADPADDATLARWSQMWRIADDLWDGWVFPNRTATGFPNGIRSAFDNLAIWNRFTGGGHWPDADMLPFGPMRPHPGWGDPRDAGLDVAETRTAFTLWSIARSPLILGGNLTLYDPQVRAIVTNVSVIALDQQDRASHPLTDLPPALADARVWVSGRRGRTVDPVALFNLGDKPLAVDASWTELGLPAGPRAACDLWTGTRLAAAPRVRTTIAAHDVALLRLGTGGCPTG